MNACSESGGIRVRWPSFAALVLAMAVVPAYANGDNANGNTQRTDETFNEPPDGFTNPCYRFNDVLFTSRCTCPDPMNPQPLSSQPVCTSCSEDLRGVEGTRRVVTRNTTTPNSSEFRQDTTRRGTADGNQSQVRYVVNEDHRFVARSGQQVSRFEDRLRQGGDPKFVVVQVPQNAGARKFFITQEQQTIINPHGVVVKEPKNDTKCQDRHGKDRGDHDD